MGRVAGVCLEGEGLLLVSARRVVPDHPGGGRQGQAAPVPVGGAGRQEVRRFREQAGSSLACGALAWLNTGTGGNEGAIARQHDVQAIHNLVKRFFTLKRHANNTPDHHFEGKTALA
ncbi:hypothetical protein AWZ86_22960 [Shigella sonnei]|nr:hypothetical protein AWZ86_22960 [Shigella sonnei]